MNINYVAEQQATCCGQQATFARNMLLVARNKLLVRATCCAGVRGIRLVQSASASELCCTGQRRERERERGNRPTQTRRVLATDYTCTVNHHNVQLRLRSVESRCNAGVGYSGVFKGSDGATPPPCCDRRNFWILFGKFFLV